VVMGKSDRKAQAHAFLDWLLTAQVQGSLSKFGLASVQ
jgi:molybdate transport system substrate-binding protein